MKPEQMTRRQILEQCIGRGLLVGGVAMSAPNLLAFWQKTEEPRKATPPNDMGPFYKKGTPEVSDSAAMRAPGDPGLPLRVSGRILNTRGDVVPEARIQLWQADHFGKYDLMGYRYRARLAVSREAAYQFETVFPGHYPDRVAQHIHYLITAPGHKTLVTQLYFATDPVFLGDPDKYYSKDPLVQTRELIRPVTVLEQADTPAHAEVIFEVCLERA
jgi:protocatechuate 3,4-dioxygenase beta subunit